MSQTPDNTENIHNLISEMKKGNCVAFIGAGVSAPAIRTWNEAHGTRTPKKMVIGYLQMEAL